MPTDATAHDPHDRSPERLLQAFVRGDRAAGSALMARLGPLVLATCRRTCGDAALAEDAAQETFLTLVRAPHVVHGSVAAWLHRVATTRSLDLVRREARQRRRHQAAAAALPAATADAVASPESLPVDVVLQSLPGAARTLLVRHVLEGVPQSALARDEGCSQATISRRITDALALLRARLEGHVPREAEVAMLALLATPPPAVPVALAARLQRCVRPALGRGAPLASTLLAGGAAVGVAGAVLLSVGPAAPLAATAPPVASAPAAVAPAAVPPAPPPPQPATTPVDQALLLQARDALVQGDVPRLAALLHAHPGLARARIASDVGPYSGYFHHATLLHHIAGNPSFGPLPVPHALESARLLLAAGAGVDARTDAGPSQPTDPGWTTLGLIATAGSGMGDEVVPLIDLLVAAGADVDDDHGLPLLGAMSYGCPVAVAALLRHHARADARVAAYQGDAVALARWFQEDGGLRAGAIGACRYGGGPRPTDDAGRRAELLTWACMGPTDATACVQLLLAHGADVHRALDGATALHQAAYRDHQGVVRLLLAHGADPARRDDRYHATPAGWADHAHHAACAALIRAAVHAPAPTTTGSGF